MRKPAALVALAALAALPLLAGVGTSVASAPPPTAPPETVPATPVPATPVPADDVATIDTGSVDPSDGFVSGPEISAARAVVAPGSRVRVSVDGFESLSATIMTCGNEARRGSSDCNMAGAFANEFAPDGAPMALQYMVLAPPVDCPCVLRAVGRDSREVAITPIVVEGHPVGPLVDPPAIGNLVEVTISAEPRATGMLDAVRSSLGGRASYEVTVIVRNVTTSPLRDVNVSGTVGRGSDSLESLELDDPGTLAVGQSWRQTIDAIVPAPSFGEVTWRVVASGAGPTVETTLGTSHRPWLLIVLILTLVLNVGLLLMRWRIRRRAEAAEEAEVVSSDLSPSGGPPVLDEPVGIRVDA